MGWRARAARLGALAALVAGPVRALPEAIAEALAPPDGAVVLRDAPAEPGTAALPLRVAGAEAGVTARVSGGVSERAWRTAEGPATLSVIDGAEAALGALGYETALRCAADACGGFAFRDAIAVFPQPDMAVNLSDFRQLTMRKAGPEGGETLVSLLASRFGDATLAQIVVVEDARPARTISAPPEAARSPPAAEKTPPAAAPPSAPLPDTTDAEGSDGLLETLRARGRVVLDGVAFEQGSTALSPASADAVERAAAALDAAPELRIVVVGHTDASGSLDVNRRVSRARADSVRRALVEAGVSAERLAAEGVGYLAPRAPHGSEDGPALNRRVELVALP